MNIWSIQIILLYIWYSVIVQLIVCTNIVYLYVYSKISNITQISLTETRVADTIVLSVTVGLSHYTTQKITHCRIRSFINIDLMSVESNNHIHLSMHTFEYSHDTYRCHDCLKMIINLQTVDRSIGSCIYNGQTK
jgi:hypothetical protein